MVSLGLPRRLELSISLLDGDNMCQETFCGIKKELIEVISFVHRSPKCFAQLLAIVGELGSRISRSAKAGIVKAASTLSSTNFVFAMMLARYKAIQSLIAIV